MTDPAAESHSSPPAPPFPSMLAWQGLLDLLAANRFSIGVSEILRMEALLRQLPPDTPPDRYKYLLAPIFAGSAEQQEKFHALCDTFLAAYAPSRESPTPPPEQLSRWRLLPAVLVLLAVLAISLSYPAYRHWKGYPSGKRTGSSTQSTNKPPSPAGDSGKPDPGSSAATPPSTGTGKPPKDDIGPAPSPPVSHEFVIDVVDRKHGAKPELDLTTPSLWDLYGWKAVAAALAAPGAIAWSVLWLIRRRSPVKRRTPPFRWPLKVDPPERSLHDLPAMMETARRMRTRQTADHDLLDVERSIERTIGEGGFPTLVRRPAMRRPEYLVLIDRRSMRDHLAAFYSELVRTFKREGIHADYYFFDDDLRLCRGEQSDESIEVAQLTARLAASHRLIVIADGRRLLDPVTGRLPDWMSLFLKWKERALFLPEPIPARGREGTGAGLRELSSLFWLFPADFGGLREFLERLLGDERATAEAPDSLPIAAPRLPERFSEERLAALRRYLGEDGYLWLRLCALYPELRWNLTLFLAALPSLAPRTRSRENAERLSRLEWFRAGVIPDMWRWELMRRLPDEVEREARAALVRLMEREPPPEGSYAEEAFLLELALQRWAAKPNEENRKQLGLQLGQMQPDEIRRRDVLMQMLRTERPRSRGHALRRWLDRLLHPDGIPEMGYRPSVRAALGIGVAIGCLTLVFIRMSPHSPFRQVDAPVVRFEKPAMDLGVYEPGMEGRLTIHLHNKTANPFRVADMKVEPAGAFALDTKQERDVVVPPKGEKSVVVTFNPQIGAAPNGSVPPAAKTHKARLTFRAAGPRSAYALPLRAVLTPIPDLAIEPRDLQFTKADRNQPKFMKITNRGRQAVRVSVVIVAHSALQLDDDEYKAKHVKPDSFVRIEFELQPGESRRVPFVYTGAPAASSQAGIGVLRRLLSGGGPETTYPAMLSIHVPSPPQVAQAHNTASTGVAEQPNKNDRAVLPVSPESGAFAGQVFYTNSHAVIIGINKYPSLKGQNLRYAVQDAQGVREMLIKYYAFSPDNIIMLLDGDATKGNIQRALFDLTDGRRVKETDRVLVFFAGHGNTVKLPSGGEMGFLLPSDALVDMAQTGNPSSYLQTCIDLKSVWTTLEACSARHRLLIADACFGGLLARSRAPQSAKPNDRTMKLLLAMSALQVITAGDSFQQTIEAPEWGHGAFTYKLLEHLRAHAATTNDVFLASELGAELKTAVSDLTNGRQLPQFANYGGTEGDFLFLTTKPRPVPPYHAGVPPPQPIINNSRINPKDGAEMVHVPAGAFTMGDTDQSDNPPHKVTLSGYYIYKNLVTVAQYRKFCSATSHKMPRAPSWGWKEDHPIMTVNWNDAQSYCKWAGVRLPTEAEWEKAARGTDGRKYPWGNAFDSSKLQSSKSAVGDAKSTAPVGSFASGASPYGALDMAGNVWQWCQDLYDASYWKSGAEFNNPVNLKIGTSRVLRGGSWLLNNPDNFLASYRNGYVPAFRITFYGFRCASQD